MRRILIVNRGLSALKFILSIRDCYISHQVWIVGLSTPDDLLSDYKYLTLVNEVIEASNTIYMDIKSIIKLCLENQIDAVFPGWGYLSEDADFPLALEQNKITFMGPSSKTMSLLGNKINSTIIAHKNGVPIIKWSGKEPLKNLSLTIQAVKKIGIPCVLKDANGGGGKGIRILRDDSEKTISQAFDQIIVEMKRDSTNACIFAMELMQDCRHIEIQILGDGYNAMHLYGRDCTIQRRNQKLIEEGPITVVPADIIRQCEISAVKMARYVNYKGVGTAEFLYSPHNNCITFLEINPRLQVEHIVTELLLDVNIPVLLYRLTCENKTLDKLFLDFPNIYMDDSKPYLDIVLPSPTRHVIACRLNAENPENEFNPSCGVVRSIEIPNILHSWSYISIMNGGQILGAVDSQFGHLFTYGSTREEACRRMTRLISQSSIIGEISNSLDFIKNIIQSPTFINNLHTTLWVKHDLFRDNNIIKRCCSLHKYSLHTGLSDLAEKKINTLNHQDILWILALISQGWFRLEDERNKCFILQNKGHHVDIPKETEVCIEIPMSSIYIEGKFSLLKSIIKNDLTWNIYNLIFKNKFANFQIEISINNISTGIIICSFKNCNSQFRVNMQTHDNKYEKFKISINNQSYSFTKPLDPDAIYSPISGKISKIYYSDYYYTEDVIIELEAMKMIFPFKSSKNSSIDFFCESGQTVKEGQIIARYKKKKNNSIEIEIVEDKLNTKEHDIKLLFETVPDFIVTPFTNNINENKVLDSPSERYDPLKMIKNLSWSNIKRIIGPESKDYQSEYQLINLKNVFNKTWSRSDFEHISIDQLFDLENSNSGVIGLLLQGHIPLILILHHPTFNKTSFGINETKSFKFASYLSRQMNISRIYISRTSGASLDYDPVVSQKLISYNNQLYINQKDYLGLKGRLVIDHQLFKNEYYQVIKINNSAIETLDCCASIASETSLAYKQVFTLTYVCGYSVGIGAYLTRLGHRVIQRKNDAPIILTGYKALNCLLGDNLYLSNDQLGGNKIMGPNGISHRMANNDYDGIKEIQLWLDLLYSPIGVDQLFISNKNIWSPINQISYELSEIIDKGLWFETMPEYATSILTGRAFINSQAFGIIIANPRSTEITIPVDPGNLDSEITVENKNGAVLYPDSSFKIAQTINNVNHEKIPLFVWINWRGFSGGTRDMFNQVLKFGSMIVDALRQFNYPVYAYVPPGAELRGGAMVVFSPGINSQIRMWADPSARVGVLEPSGAYEVKYRNKLFDMTESQVISSIELYDIPANSEVIQLVKLKDLKNKIKQDLIG